MAGEERASPADRWDGIAETLLEHNFVLTALEFYSESLEAGKELARLKNFFSNPGNFERAAPQVAEDPGQ